MVFLLLLAAVSLCTISAQLSNDPGLPFEIIAAAEVQDSKPENVSIARDPEVVAIAANDTAGAAPSLNETVIIIANDTADATSKSTPKQVRLPGDEKIAQDDPLAKEDVKAPNEKPKLDQKLHQKTSADAEKQS